MKKIHWPLMALAILIIGTVATLEHSVIRKNSGDQGPTFNRIWIKD